MPLSEPDRSALATWATAGRLRRYVITTVVMGVTFTVTLAVARIVPNVVGDLFYPALGAIAWVLGPDAALLGVGLAIAAEAYLTPETPFPAVDDVLYVLLFGLTALAMVHLSRLQRRAWRVAEQRAQDALDANAAKDRFLDLVSHDLRGPLQAVRLWSRILRLDRFNPATVERGCDAIESCVRQQDRLVSDLLDAARVRAGTIALQVRPTPLRPVLDRALEMVAPGAEVKGLSLAPPRGELDINIAADPDRLAQVLWNLLANAVKFTDRGGEVAVVVERRNGSVQIHVRDTGRGLSPEECRRAFEPYWQQERGDGLGLGLLIARRLVELHGGVLSVTSPGPGRGSDFAVSLPAIEFAA